MAISLDRYVDVAEHSALDHTGIAGSVQEIQIDGAGTPLAGGPWKALRFPGGGITDLGSGVANIAVTGPAGPTGPAGSSGPAGPTGPSGAGFTQFGSNSTSRVVNVVPPTAFNVSFGTGFVWKMGAAACSDSRTNTGHAGMTITSISGWNTTTLQVNGVEEGGAIPGTEGARKNINVSYAG